MEVTLEITSVCPHNCEYCSTNAKDKGEHLDYEVVLAFIQEHYKKNGSIDRINISGGEPLSHPRFYEILLDCEAASDDVRVYSNAIKKIHYNTDIIKEVEVHAHICMRKGKSVYIPKLADEIHFLKITNKGRAANESVFTNKIKISGEKCSECNHALLQADGKIVKAPCKKEY